MEYSEYPPTASAMLFAETGDERWLDPAYARRMAGQTIAARQREKVKADAYAEVISKRRSDKVFSYLKALCVTSKKNALKRGLDYSLDDDWLWETYLACDGKCSVTGVSFDLNRHGSARAPYAPSLDRMNCAVGYTKDNVRIVCQIANLAMNVWGSDVLLAFIAKARME